MTLFDNLLTVFILVFIAVIAYLKYSKKTFVEFVREIREAFSETTEEVKGGVTP